MDLRLEFDFEVLIPCMDTRDRPAPLSLPGSEDTSPADREKSCKIWGQHFKKEVEASRRCHKRKATTVLSILRESNGLGSPVASHDSFCYEDMDYTSQVSEQEIRNPYSDDDDIEGEEEKGSFEIHTRRRMSIPSLFSWTNFLEVDALSPLNNGAIAAMYDDTRDNVPCVEDGDANFTEDIECDIFIPEHMGSRKSSLQIHKQDDDIEGAYICKASTDDYDCSAHVGLPEMTTGIRKIRISDVSIDPVIPLMFQDQSDIREEEKFAFLHTDMDMDMDVEMPPDMCGNDDSIEDLENGSGVNNNSSNSSSNSGSRATPMNSGEEDEDEDSVSYVIPSDMSCSGPCMALPVAVKKAASAEPAALCGSAIRNEEEPSSSMGEEYESVPISPTTSLSNMTDWIPACSTSHNNRYLNNSNNNGNNNHPHYNQRNKKRNTAPPLSTTTASATATCSREKNIYEPKVKSGGSGIFTGIVIPNEGSLVSPSKLESHGICVACLDGKGDVDIKLLPCLHCFHSSCIRDWMETGNQFCPVCHQFVGRFLPLVPHPSSSSSTTFLFHENPSNQSHMDKVKVHTHHARLGV